MAPRTRNSKKSQINKQVKQILNSQREEKAVTAAGAYVDTVAGVISNISQTIVQGDQINNRSGDSISPYRIEFNYSLLGGVGSTNSLHRVLLYQDLLFNEGNTPAIADILDATTYNSTYDLRNFQQHRFKILHDKIHGVVGQADSAATHVQKRIALNGKIHFAAAGNVLAANARGAIFLLTMTDSVTVSTATFSYYLKIHYHDS